MPAIRGSQVKSWFYQEDESFRLRLRHLFGPWFIAQTIGTDLSIFQLEWHPTLWPVALERKTNWEDNTKMSITCSFINTNQWSRSNLEKFAKTKSCKKWTVGHTNEMNWTMNQVSLWVLKCTGRMLRFLLLYLQGVLHVLPTQVVVPPDSLVACNLHVPYWQEWLFIHAFVGLENGLSTS